MSCRIHGRHEAQRNASSSQGRYSILASAFAPTALAQKHLGTESVLSMEDTHTHTHTKA